MARSNKLDGLSCPEDKIEIPLNMLKSLNKNLEILDFIEKLE